VHAPTTERPVRILVTEDDPTVSEVVTRYLQREGYQVEAASDGRAAVELVRRDPPDLMVLDLMLPGMDGFEVCRRVRSLAPVPIIMLTARGQEADRVMGLDLGADDYVAKPFSPRELTARVKSVLRRAGGWLESAAPELLVAGTIELDIPGRQVRVEGATVTLTVREFDLLAFLMGNTGRVFRREELLERVWGYTYGDTSTVTVHVRRLREKVERDPAAPRHIQTVWGVGYRFEP
jgi:two-component system response regulator ResD